MEITPHPSFLEILFAHKSKVSAIFRDVLGIKELSHIAISCVNAQKKLLTFSSTPALEYNLFSSNLWCFDNTYCPDWYERCTQSLWQSLYVKKRYDELYYMKQIRHHYPLGISMAASWQDHYFIYSLASQKSCAKTQEHFSEPFDDFYKIGQYCSNALLTLFAELFAQTEQFSLHLQPAEMA